MRPRVFRVQRDTVSEGATVEIRRSFRSAGFTKDSASSFLELVNGRLSAFNKNALYEGPDSGRQVQKRARTADLANRRLLRVEVTLMSFLKDKSAIAARNKLDRAWLALLTDARPDAFDRAWMAKDPDAAFRLLNTLKATHLLGLLARATKWAASIPGRKGNPSASSHEILFWSQIGEALFGTTDKRPTAATKGLFSDVCRIIAQDQGRASQVPSRTILEKALRRLPKSLW